MPGFYFSMMNVDQLVCAAKSFNLIAFAVTIIDLFSCRWSEFLALLSLSTTFFLFLQTRDLSLQLTNERRKHSIDGSTGWEEHSPPDRVQGQEPETVNPGKISSQEREFFVKVILRKITDNDNLIPVLA